MKDWSLRPLLAFVLLIRISVSAEAATVKDLAAKIDAVINGPNYKQAHWGILVVDAKTGETVYSQNADKLFKPASTTKLFSTAAALAALGADHRFQTPVYMRGQLEKGELKGDLILVASGDLTLGGRTDQDGKLAFKDHDHIYAGNLGGRCEVTDTDPLAGLKELAKQIAAAGIKKVTGTVLVDDRLFPKNKGTGSGPDILTPILVNDNLVDVIVSPGQRVGDPAKIQMRPQTSFMKIDAQVKTVGKRGRNRLVVRPVGPWALAVRGQILIDAKKPALRIYPVQDPAVFARACFIDCLRAAGIKLQASPLDSPAVELPAKTGYKNLKRVALFTSPPFSEVVKVTLKVSHNLYASLFPILVAVKHGKGTLNEGLRQQGKFLGEIGVDTKSISFGGGAGGSSADALTPRAVIQLFQALVKRGDYKAFEAGLPRLAVDGTLEDAAPRDSPAKGKVAAKTGTYYSRDAMNDRLLLTSKALGGVMTTAQNRNLIVAIFVNRVPLAKGVSPLREGKVIGKLCEIIFLHCPTAIANKKLR